MLFSSMTFIFIFLPCILAVYYSVTPRLRNHVLMLGSILFYAWGEPLHVLTLFLTIGITYTGAILVDSFRKKAKFFLAIAVCADLSILIYFKYTNFIIENINLLFRGQIDPLKVIMPIGISFYTFQAISYLVDVYRNECKVQKNFYDLALYVVLFPQMIAGPIVKYHDIAEQITCREISADDLAYGTKRFIIGLSKKILIANSLGQIVETVFNLSTDRFDTPTAWLGAAAYTFQLYYDFSGYSDMAIGLGKMFGFHFQENFNYPYISRSITDFWRRWHISMSTWFKEYLYIPLGGNRNGNQRTYLNLAVVFLATGIWHGASWNFIFWGLWHGVFIILERITSFHKSPGSIFKRTFAHIYTVFVFVIGWIMFRADTMEYAWEYIKRMFGFGVCKTALPLSFYCNNVQIFTFAAALLCAFPLFKNMPQKYTGKWAGTRTLICNIWLIGLFVLSCASIANSTFNPFIYFRF